MKYTHAVIYNGKYYRAGEEIPEQKEAVETKKPTKKAGAKNDSGTGTEA